MNTTYRQEFFDREYTAKEAYSRLWGFAKKYRFRLVMGVLCGMLTAGTLVPMFSLIQPALAKVEQRQEGKREEGRGNRKQGTGNVASSVFRLESFLRRQEGEASSEGLRSGKGVRRADRFRPAG